MLKKIYKNKGIIYISNTNDITYNNLYLKNYIKYKDLEIKEIVNITNKEYYEKIGCVYN